MNYIPEMLPNEVTNVLETTWSGLTGRDSVCFTEKLTALCWLSRLPVTWLRELFGSSMKQTSSLCWCVHMFRRKRRLELAVSHCMLPQWLSRYRICAKSCSCFSLSSWESNPAVVAWLIAVIPQPTSVGRFDSWMISKKYVINKLRIC